MFEKLSSNTLFSIKLVLLLTGLFKNSENELGEGGGAEGNAFNFFCIKKLFKILILLVILLLHYYTCNVFQSHA